MQSLGREITHLVYLKPHFRIKIASLTAHCFSPLMSEAAWTVWLVCFEVASISEDQKESLMWSFPHLPMVVFVLYHGWDYAGWEVPGPDIFLQHNGTTTVVVQL